MHPNETVITDFVDDALPQSERAGVEQHLETCAACRALVEDMRAIRAAARSLDVREPPVRSWSRLERAIKLEAEAHGAPSAASDSQAVDAWRRAAFQPATLAWLAAAAALVVAVYVGMRTRPATPPPSSVAADSATSGSAQAVESELRAAEQHYENAIKGLEQITNAEQAALDPATAATLQKNLAVIDQAITESRAALRTQPTSEPAQQSLIESFKSKIALLQDTVALINEMRKGNDAGAARIVSGLKQKG
jgi:anti-sigma factor RsiW